MDITVAYLRPYVYLVASCVNYVVWKTWRCHRFLLKITENIFIGISGQKVFIAGCIFASVPRTHNSFDDRSFTAAGLLLRNTLSPGLRQPELKFDTFRHYLKTFLFFSAVTAAHSPYSLLYSYVLYKSTYLYIYTTMKR